LLGFAALLALTAHDYFHGPQFTLAAPATLATWSVEQVFGGIPSRWLIGIWLAGAVVLLAAEGAGAWRLRALIRASVPLTDADWQRTLQECREQLDLAAPMELRVSDRLGPAATGLRRRIILLPPDCRGWTTEERRFVLLHELAHFRHGDLAARLFARVVCAIQWFNPFAWQLARRMDFDREAACDSAVVAETAAPGAYAETLLAFAESAVAAPVLPISAFGAPRRSTLEARILRLLAPGGTSPAWRRWGGTLLAIASLSMAAILCACSWQHPASPEDEVRLRLTADPFPGER
jgi:beta-lactamase regulating signal transducer with metallopeptidase domain